MSAPNEISCEKLLRLIGTPHSPRIIDVRTDEDYAGSPSLIPGSLRRAFSDVETWGTAVDRDTAVIVCQRGLKLSHGVAAWLRHLGIEASSLEGGYEAWQSAANPLLRAEHIPPRDQKGRTVWVTRARPKIDRIACPWLIRRFVDPLAVFLFVAPSEVKMVGERFAATPFDIEDTFWSHRGGNCTFDTMIDEFGISTEPLQRLATIVRGADTARLDLAPEAAGLLAVSLGLSRMYADDLEQLDAGMLLYDALYRWCRDATGEKHNWPTNKPSA
jgi:rhodanese-related sulfurtransferase